MLKYARSWKSALQIESKLLPKILTFNVTLTLDLGCKKLIFLSISYNMRQVGGLYNKYNKTYGQNCYFDLLHDLDLHPSPWVVKNCSPSYKLRYETSWKFAWKIEPNLWPKILVLHFMWPWPLSLDKNLLAFPWFPKWD